MRCVLLIMAIDSIEWKELPPRRRSLSRVRDIDCVREGPKKYADSQASGGRQSGGMSMRRPWTVG
jgi:hypothetical protein